MLVHCTTRTRSQRPASPPWFRKVALFDLNLALTVWLTNTLTGLSVGVWSAVVSLADGPGSPVWRWVLVEQGFFTISVVFAAWWLRIVLGVGKVRRTPQHWGTAAVFASMFSFLLDWYHLTATTAIALGLHPTYGWEWNFFTWGLPMLLVQIVMPTVSFVVQLGISVALGAFALLVLGALWAALPGPNRRATRSGKTQQGRNYA